MAPQLGTMLSPSPSPSGLWTVTRRTANPGNPFSARWAAVDACLLTFLGGAFGEGVRGMLGGSATEDAEDAALERALAAGMGDCECVLPALLLSPSLPGRTDVTS